VKRLWGRLKAAIAQRAAMSFPRMSSWFFGWYDVSASDYERAVGDGFDSNVLTTPILWIARALPEGRWAVRLDKPDGTSEKDYAHPLVTLLLRPNPAYSWLGLLFATLLSYLTKGTAYWLKVRGARGQVAELWYLPHWLVEPKGNEREYLTHYTYKPGSTAIRLDPANVVAFRYGLDPRDMRMGFAPLKPVLAEVFSDDEAQRLVAALLKNRGIPGVLISPDKDVPVGDEDAQAMKAYVHEHTTGPRRGEPMVLRGATKVSTFGFTPQEMDLGAIRNVPEERVCAALGLRASVVGFGTGLQQTKVGATMAEDVRLSWTMGVLPIARMLALDITHQLLPDFEPSEAKRARLSVCYDSSEVEALKPDRAAETQAAREAYQGGIATRGEARKMIGLEARPEDEVLLVPIAMIEVPREQPIEERIAPALPEPEPPPADPPPAEGEEGEEDDEGRKALKRRRLTQLQARILRARAALAKRRIPAFQARTVELLEDMGADLEAAYRLALAQEKAEGFDAKTAEDELRIERIFAAWNMPKHRREFRSFFGREYYAIHNEQAAVLAELGVAVNLPDNVAVQMLAAGSARADKMALDKLARQQMRDILAEAREEGLGIDETARRLRDSIPAGRYRDSRTRAQVIARTEVREAQTQSALLAYRATEGVAQVMMIDGRLGPTDADCEAMDGTVVSFEEAQRLLAEEHPNGTRDIVPVFQEAAA